MYKIRLDYIVVIFDGCLARGAKFSALLVFAEGKEYNKRRSFGEGAESLLIERT